MNKSWLFAIPAVLVNAPLAAQEVPSAPVREQTPVAPFPYHTAEVFVEGGVRLACTLSLPDGHEAATDGGAPGAVLLTVAGPNDRDQTHFGHKPFFVLADHLARQGVASLRCDDRGVGGSEGQVTSASMDDLVGDAMAMHAFLSERAGGPVGFIGNSEGSVVGSLAAATYPDQVGFAVLLGGVGVEGAALIRERLLAQGRAGGLSAEQLDAGIAPFDALTAAVREAGGLGAERLLAERPEVAQRLRTVAQSAGQNDPMLPRSAEARFELFAGPWYYAQLTLDGGEILERVSVPVLALTGTKDRTNLPDQNLPAIRAALDRAGNPDATVEEIPDLNHVFQTAVVGGMMEYGTLEESFAPAALERIAGWIVDRFK